MNPLVQQHLAQVDELQAERQELWSRWDSLLEQRSAITYAPDRTFDDETRAKLDELSRQTDAIYARTREIGDAVKRELDAANEEIAKDAERFHRPGGRWRNLVGRLLGPSPTDIARIDYDATEFAQVPNRWFLAIAMIFVVLAGVVASSTLLPFAGSSPVSLVFGQDLAAPIVNGLLTGVVLVVLGLHIAGKISVKELIYNLAVFEEQWFRQGAEGWNWKRRLGSCVGFGIVHLFNLIYLFATAGMIMVLGLVLMAVYLHEMSRTGDQRRSVIAAAKVHANYNFVALGLAAAGLTAYWVTLLSPLIR